MKHAYLQNRRSLAVLVVLLCSVLLCLGSVVTAATVLPVQNVTADPENSLMPHVAQDMDGNLHLVWDTKDGSRQVAYRKGVWNGSGYSFGPTTILADVENFGYSTPAVAIAPNGTLLVAWSNQFQVFVRSWNARDAQPGGTATQIMPGFDTNIAVDNANRFHIVANGDFHIQYCEWNNGCSSREAFGRDRNADPDVAVDSNGSVHVVTWGGGTINYFNRPAGGGWSNSVLANGGNVPQVTTDGQGNVYAVWSQDYNIQYCRVVNRACTEQQMFDAARDLSPSIAATQAGSIVIAFYDADDKRLWLVTREKGTWSGPQNVGNGPTGPDLTVRPFTNRISAVWSLDWDIFLTSVVLSETVTPPPPTPTPTPIPPKFNGSLVVNGGAEVTTNPQVSVTINNTSADVPSSYSLADGVEPGTPSTPFTNPSTTTSFSLNVADGRCRIHTINGKLGNTTGTSATFSDNILFDPSADALIIARNPNLPTNPEINQFFAASLPSGDIAFTRRKDFNTWVGRGPNECSNLTRYAFVKHGKPLTDTDWRNMPAEGFVSAYTTFTPDLPSVEGAYQFDGYVEDSVGHKTTNPYVVTIVYDVTGPTVSGASGPLTTTPSPKGGVAEINTSGLTINDNLYTDPGNTRKYWGYWIAVKKTDAGAPTEDEWAQFGFVKGGLMASPLSWNISRGIVGGINGFTPGQHTVYIRYLDGAGNWSNTVNSQSVQVNQLELLTRLPMLSR